MTILLIASGCLVLAAFDEGTSKGIRWLCLAIAVALAFAVGWSWYP